MQLTLQLLSIELDSLRRAIERDVGRLRPDSEDERSAIAYQAAHSANLRLTALSALLAPIPPTLLAERDELVGRLVAWQPSRGVRAYLHENFAELAVAYRRTASRLADADFEEQLLEITGRDMLEDMRCLRQANTPGFDYPDSDDVLAEPDRSLLHATINATQFLWQCAHREAIWIDSKRWWWYLDEIAVNEHRRKSILRTFESSCA